MTAMRADIGFRALLPVGSIRDTEDGKKSITLFRERTLKAKERNLLKIRKSKKLLERKSIIMGNYVTNYFVREVEAEKHELQEQVNELRQENEQLRVALRLTPYFVRDKSYLNFMLEASKAVCYIKLPDGKAGTGFLVSNDVVLTALHVITPDYENDASKISAKLRETDFTFSFFRDARTGGPETTFRALTDDENCAIVYFPGKKLGSESSKPAQAQTERPDKIPDLRRFLDFILVRLKSQPEAEGAESALDGKTFIPLPLKRYTKFGNIPTKENLLERREATNNLATVVKNSKPPVTTLYHRLNMPLHIFQSRITGADVENDFLEFICFTYGLRLRDKLSLLGASGSPLLDDDGGLIGMHLRGSDAHSKAIYVNSIIEQLHCDKKKQKLPLVKRLLDDVLRTQEDQFMTVFKPKETVMLSLKYKQEFEECRHNPVNSESDCRARYVYDAEECAEAPSWITQVVELKPLKTAKQLPYKATVLLSHSFLESSPILLLWNEDPIVSTRSPVTFQIIGEFDSELEANKVDQEIVERVNEIGKGIIEVDIVFSGNLCRLAAKCTMKQNCGELMQGSLLNIRN
ncbi:uncharacterized protein [Oscarella lobularis]|uniref:uncharacterized protein isoform X2 n=1 Tax=Oscarella lobularis TaxID=121494 RepID=UPI0033137141